MNHLNFILAFEGGEITHRELAEGFQKMINDGLVWQLQGMYGRTAVALLERGLCTPAGTPDPDLDEVLDLLDLND